MSGEEFFDLVSAISSTVFYPRKDNVNVKGAIKSVVFKIGLD